MAQEYFPAQKPLTTITHPEAHSPALTEDDEEFLKRITSPNPNEQEVIIFDAKGKASKALAGADQVPLPVSPPPVEEKPATPGKSEKSARPAAKESKSRRKLSTMFTSIRSSLPVSFGKVCVKRELLGSLQAEVKYRNKSRVMQPNTYVP
jgi:hypothetical protein